MKYSEIFYICIIPLLTIGLLFIQSRSLLTNLNLKNIAFISVAIAIMGFSIYDGIDKFYKGREDASHISNLQDSVSNLQDSVSNLQDSLKHVKDTLINIGIGIDEKTGRLLVMDSQLLKKEFTKVFHITQNYSQLQPQSLFNAPIIEMPDSENYEAITRNDTLYLYPKNGTWVHAYYAHDTANSKAFINNFTEGMGTANFVDKITVNNKTYNTHIWKIYDRAVYRNNPIRLNMVGYKNRYIIFGDEGIPSKRWIYQSGKVTWIPEE